MKINLKTRINFEVYLQLNESEARAMDALVGYGVEEFLKVFYKHMGRAYMEPHEAGLRTFFKSFREDLPSELAAIDKIKKEIANRAYQV